MQRAAGHDGFHDFLVALRQEVIAFEKPVAYVHGDPHYFRVDKRTWLPVRWEYRLHWSNSNAPEQVSDTLRAEYDVPVPAHGRASFTTGAAHAEADAIVRSRGTVVDEQEWTRGVKIEVAP